MTATRGVGLLLLLLGLAVALRLLALDLDGHHGDVRVTAGWATRMAEVGPWQFYDGGGSIYPALLYPLWGIGAVLEGEALRLAVKGLSIPFDLALGVGLYAVMRRRSGEALALAIAALFLLNPAAILAGPVWGQVDSAGTLVSMGALLALATRRHGIAGALAVVAVLVKPQFGIVVLPVFVVAVLRGMRLGTWRPVLRTAIGMAGAYLVIAAPLALHPWRYLGLLGETATRQPYTSLNAFNPWALLVGIKVPDDAYVGIGTLLLGVGCTGALLGLRRRPRLAVALGVAAALALAFYFLPTRVHERYLFPAVALLAPFAVVGRVELTAYVALSLGFAASLLYALHDTTPFQLPAPWAAWVTSEAGIWTIGLVLIGSALAWTWLLVVRRPRLPHRRRR